MLVSLLGDLDRLWRLPCGCRFLWIASLPLAPGFSKSDQQLTEPFLVAYNRTHEWYLAKHPELKTMEDHPTSMERPDPEEEKPFVPQSYSRVPDPEYDGLDRQQSNTSYQDHSPRQSHSTY